MESLGKWLSISVHDTGSSVTLSWLTLWAVCISPLNCETRSKQELHCPDSKIRFWCFFPAMGDELIKSLFILFWQVMGSSTQFVTETLEEVFHADVLSIRCFWTLFLVFVKYFREVFWFFYLPMGLIFVGISYYFFVLVLQRFAIVEFSIFSWSAIITLSAIDFGKFWMKFNRRIESWTSCMCKVR
jgi:hypothetical protein